jgi:preprotein translocase YajC subunit
MSDAALISAVFVGVVVAFYIMFMRPVAKEQESHRQQIRDLRPGDEVVTTSNFIARVRDISLSPSGQTHISLELAEGVIFTALPSAILRRLSAAPTDDPATNQQKKEASA